jgi:branched-chain amino acid transport system permease protein
MTRQNLRIALGVVIAALALYAPFYFPPADNETLSRAIYFAVAAMGLNLLTGFNGQISIGHGAFFGIGAFATAILMKDHGWTFELTIPVAALIAAIVGALVGIPALRVRGLYLALVTLGLAVLFPRLAGKYVDTPTDIPFVQPPRQEFASLLDGLANDQWQYLEALAIAALLFLLAWNLTKSRVGRAMIAVRDQELAASTLGIDIARVKVLTFALSAAYAGIAGSLSVMVEGAADATDPVLAFRNSIEFLVAVVIGGTATITGPAIGALVLVLLRRETDGLIEGKEVLTPAIFGGALIAMVFLLPGGIVGGLRKLADRVIPATPIAQTPEPSKETS